MPLSDILLAVLVTIIWGCNFLFIKWGVDEVPPLFLTVLRFAVSTVPIIFFVARPTSTLRTLALYGFLMGTLQFGLLNVAIKLGFSVSLASLVTQLQTFFTMALAAVFLGDRAKPIQVAGAVIAFGGIVLIATTRWSAQAILPFLLAVASAFFLGLSNIIAKRSGEKHPFSFVIWSGLFAAPPLLALSLLIEDHTMIMHTLTTPSWKAIGAVTYLAIASTLVGYGLWNLLLQRHPAATVAPFYLLVPIFGILSGVLVMGDDFSGLVVWGAALVFVGLILNIFGPRVLKARSA
jgi:O-acetylserine/cysteine efflux transporter